MQWEKQRIRLLNTWVLTQVCHLVIVKNSKSQYLQNKNNDNDNNNLKSKKITKNKSQFVFSERCKSKITFKMLKTFERVRKHMPEVQIKSVRQEFQHFLEKVCVKISSYSLMQIKLNSENISENHVQLTLEQHRFERCESTYLWIFFNKYCKCIFSSL